MAKLTWLSPRARRVAFRLCQRYTPENQQLSACGLRVSVDSTRKGYDYYLDEVVWRYNRWLEAGR